MNFLSILHITDLHFGLIYDHDIGADIKDNNVSDKFKQQFSSRWVKFFQDALQQNWINRGKSIDYICFTGDLIQAGKMTKDERIDLLEEGILFLRQLCDSIGLGIDKLILSPGNHDADRNNESNEFEDLLFVCNKYGINNISTNTVLEINVSNGIKILSSNSCIGATEKIFEYDKDYFQKQLDLVSFKEGSGCMEVDSKYTYQKDLDIPAIGDDQNTSICNIVSKSDVKDACILLMHHNPIPTNCIEIRPYANLIDGGRLLNSLLDTGKKVFILHGHTHFESFLTSYLPSSQGNNYVSIIGSAALNGSPSSKASILEFVFSDDERHIKTDISEIYRNGASFKIKNMFSICNMQDNIDLDLQWNSLIKNKSYRFEKVKELLLYNGDDDDLAQKILFMSPKMIKIGRNNSSDYKEWTYTRDL